MPNKKPCAVLLYPGFSLQEITCITSCLAVWFGEEPQTLASEKKLYRSEEGFRLMPDKTLDEADPAGYACIILPGTINPLPALYDDKLLGFLAGGKGGDTLYAAISSAPVLLAKAGLLEGKTFTAGFFMQLAEAFPFVDKERFVHRPVVEDGNVITAIGMFFREFAERVLCRLGYDVGEDFLLPATQAYTEEDLTFYWTQEDYQEFLQELQEYEHPQAARTGEGGT